MKHILAKAQIEVLAQLAWSRVLLAFDFDGTLAPIVERPDDAQMRGRTRALLRRVCERYPCAVLSGRSRRDVVRRLEGTRPKYVLGNHGLEPHDRPESFERAIAPVRELLAELVAPWPGVELEDKQYSLAVHYRRSRRKRDLRRTVLSALAESRMPVRIVPGKLVLNVLPRGAPHKGDALVHVRTEEDADVALYVGDDATDEDVFEIDQPGRLVSVRVGAARRSAASYFLRDQREIDRLLATLASMRNGSTAR